MRADYDEEQFQVTCPRHLGKYVTWYWFQTLIHPDYVLEHHLIHDYGL